MYFISDSYQKARKKADRYIIVSDDDYSAVESQSKRRRTVIDVNGTPAEPPAHPLIAGNSCSCTVT
jgi:hypothetical protein